MTKNRVKKGRVPLYYYGIALSVVVILSFQLTSSSPSSSSNDDLETMKIRRETELPILDVWFPKQSLNDAWEEYPLLSTVYVDVKNGYERSKSIHVVSNHDNIAHMQQTLPNLFSIQHIDAIVTSDPTINFQEDIKMVKKIWRDGAEWTGVLPLQQQQQQLQGTHILDQLMSAFQHGGFSMIINELQRRWGSVAQMAHSLHQELMPHFVSCNLYLTPASSDLTSSGFESHWDWMDVFVIQISGQKLWTVASHPNVYMSTYDLKRKPTTPEVQTYASHTQAYTDILLRPGDILYIPRGFMHNASTIGPDYPLTSHNLIDPNPNVDPNEYTKHHQALLAQPSLHLTFGIEYHCHNTYEALFHHILYNYLATLPPTSPVKQMTTLTFSTSACQKSPVLHGKQPPSRQQIQTSWEAMLHATIALISRKSTCPSIEKRTDSCALRKSVPLSKPIQEISKIQQQQTNGYCDPEDQTCQDFHNNSMMDVHFQKSLQALKNATPTLRSIFAFIHDLQKAENGASFCIPKVSFQQHQIHGLFMCDLNSIVDDINKFRKQKENVELFQSIWNDFLIYASSSDGAVYTDALQSLKVNHKKSETESFTKQKLILEKLGQSFTWQSSHD